VVTVGGVDTYYDYDEQCWKYRRLGGGPVHDRAACPAPPRPRDQRRAQTTGVVERVCVGLAWLPVGDDS
jgi:hypothetical protein